MARWWPWPECDIRYVSKAQFERTRDFVRTELGMFCTDVDSALEFIVDILGCSAVASGIVR